MIILDTNIFIYLANGMLPAEILADEYIALASVTRIEALGFGQLSVGEAAQLKLFFGLAQQFELTEAVIHRAIEVRQAKRMSLGDAIIAATALAYDMQLWTSNVKDFDWIDGLKLYNPLDSAR